MSIGRVTLPKTGAIVAGKNALPAVPIPQILDANTGSGILIAAFDGILTICVFGGAASGVGSNGAGNSGGGGGGAAYKRVRVKQGQSFPWAAGPGGASIVAGQNPGGDSTVTLPTGQVVKGGGAPSNLPGVGSGGDVNSTGGQGRGANTAGDDGSNGGDTGSAGTSDAGGGGGCAGLASAISGLTFPVLSGGLKVGHGGTGNDLNSGAQAGGSGRVLMMLQRYAGRP